MSYTREQLMEYASVSLVEYKRTSLYPFMRLRAVLAQEYLNVLHDRDINPRVLGTKAKLLSEKEKWAALGRNDELERILTILISQMNERIVAGVGIPSDVMPIIYNSIESLINPNRWANPIAPPVE